MDLLPFYFFHVKYDLLMEDERKTFNQMIERSHENKDTNIFSYIFGNYQTTVQDFVFYFIII